MKLKSAYTILLVLLMLQGILSTLQVGIVNSSPSGVALIEVSATSPHVANGTDFSEVIVTAKDAYGNPVAGANITVLKCIGRDSQETFNVTDNGDGTYSTLVNSTIAGNATILAIDLTTEVSGNTTVVFEAGHVTDIVVEATKPRDFKPRNVSDVRAMAVDAFGNQIFSPHVNITITSGFGVVSSTSIKEGGIFEATVSSNQLGVANITATDVISGMSQTIPVVFPALSIVSPSDAVLLNDLFTWTINVFVPDPCRALGFYDLKISFNNTIIRFVNISDGDPYDEFDAPHLEMIDDNTFRINQTNVASMISPTGNVDIANVTFYGTGVGYSPINITLWNDSEFSLVDTNGVPLPNMPNVGEDPTVKKKKLLRINAIVVEDSGVTEDIVKTAIKKTQEIFSNARKNCLAIQLVWDGQINWITKKEWTEIDKNGDNKLDDEPGEDLTAGDEGKALLGKYRRVCFANVYWIPALQSPGLGWGLKDEWVIIPKAGEDYDRGPGQTEGKTLAHELGHFLGVQSGNIDTDGLTGLMEYDGGTELSEEQCADMMKSKHLIGEEPDFGDAPDPTYPSKLASNGARHVMWNYEWLGKTADPTPSVNGEPDSKQVDLDEFDDGVTIAGNLVPGGNLIITVTISTSGEVGRYDVKDPNKVMYLNAWIDWNRDGVWAPLGEKIIGTGSPTGTQKFAALTVKVYNIPIPLWVSCCNTWLRFRLDYAEDVGANKQPWTDPSLNQEKGQAGYGEVEDYKIHIECPPPQGIYLHAEGGLIDLEKPLSTYWQGLCPNETYGIRYHIEKWLDNCNDRLDRCDYIYIETIGTGLKDWYHVENVTVTLYVEKKPYFNESMYIEYEGDIQDFTWQNPVCTQWKEVYPHWCNSYHLKEWHDNGNGYLDYCDQIVLRNKCTNQATEYHVSGVATDIIVTKRIPPCPPVASFTEYPKEPYVYRPVYFDASPSLPGFDGDDECPITEYRWDFGDGTTGTGKTIKHVYDKPGDYVVTLTVYAPGIPPYINPQYVDTNTTDTIQHVKHVLPVGGYSISIETHTTTTPPAAYFATITIIVAVLAAIRRKTHRKTK